MKILKGVIYTVLLLAALLDVEARPMMLIAVFVIASFSAAQSIEHSHKENWKIER